MAEVLLGSMPVGGVAVKGYLPKGQQKKGLTLPQEV